MGEVTRGAVAVLVVVVLSGSIAPAVTVTDSAAAETTVDTDVPASADQSGSPSRQLSAGVNQFGLGVGDTAGSDTGQQDDGTLGLTQRFHRLPERPGTVRVRLAYSVPARVVSMRAALPDGATFVSQRGFVRDNETHFRWRGTTQQPTLTYDYRINETIDRRGPHGTDGRALYAGTGQWALFERPPTPTYWEATGGTPIVFDRGSSTAGPGAAGEWLVYLGEHELHERTAHGQRFRLVVPAAATLSESPSAILDALANSSDALRVGDRDETVFLIAAPTGPVEWGVRGVQTGDTDAWVRDTEPLDQPDNAWLHEYVHTRQAFTPTSRTAWFTEASASYYASLLSLEQESVAFEAFRDRLARGTHPVYDGVVLSNVSTWEGAPDYDRGSLVAGELDRRLRVATDRERTLQDVFREMNGQQQPVSQLDFLELLATTGGTSVLDEGQSYTETTASVETWNRTTHAAVFGQLPARVGYELPPAGDAEGYRITGPYRNETVADDSIQLVTGERLTVDTLVSNAGGTAGVYNVSMRVNGTVVDETSGQIEAGESTTAPLSHRFPTPGTYHVVVDGERLNVTVQRPVRANVVSLDVEPTTAQQGDTVVLTATLYNGEPRPGEATVVFTRDSEEVGRRHVTMPAYNRTSIEREISLPRPGAVSLGAGTVPSVEVMVRPNRVRTMTATETPTPTATSRGDGAGPGVVALVVALSVLWVALRYRR
ncbi:glycyl aminopeptidase [Halomicrobium sp. IBSBa]|uniref:glycyl aminopeptidase n=1 Tax=Halomicrobium sp. IBSBa TaxID=2778916 RepID=UPI001ABF9419|nr:glycyl aminopeptidase [Halomicrobium sp. IBSBa]MBO4247356.1 glycyl aminopeptidase [Halomicrobium sp. IBSBa]